MGDRIVPKMVKSNLRGVLLSKVDGIPITEVLREYKMVTKEALDFQEMGFTHLIEFLKAVPDVARIVTASNRMVVVVGIALNNLNITARKSCFKSPAGKVQTDRRSMDSIISSVGGDVNGNNKPMNGTQENVKQENTKNLFKADLMTSKNFIQGISTNESTASRHKDSQVMHPPQFRQKPMLIHESQGTKLPFQSIPKTEWSNNRSDEKPQLIVNVERSHDTRSVMPTPQKNHCLTELVGIPKSMVPGTVQRMYAEVSPGLGRPRRGDYPSRVDVMLTHVEKSNSSYFWGIVIQPYDAACDDILTLDSHLGDFRKYMGERRAVVQFQNYFCRVWVKFSEGELVSVFMVDFGNCEVVPMRKLKSSTSVWKFPPVAVPFKYVGNEKIDLNKGLNERHRCYLTDANAAIFEVESISQL